MSLDTDAFVSQVTPTAHQRGAALIALAMVVLAYGALAPFAARPLPWIPAYIPATEGMMCVGDLLTAAFLYSQYSMTRSSALLILASGYIFTSLIIAARVAMFPGVFSPTGLFGAGPQSTSWLWGVWHLGLPVAITAYVALKGGEHGKDTVRSPAAHGIGLSLIIVVGLVLAIGWAAATQSYRLPDPMLDANRGSPFGHYAIGVDVSIAMLAMLLLAFRQTSVLDQWLMVSLGSLIVEQAFVIFFVSGRYSLGFYARGVYGLISSIVVLIALHAEVARAYSRTVGALVAARHDKLMGIQSATGALAHEIRQPLATIALEVGVAREYLRRSPPDLEVVLESLEAITDSTRRTTEIITSVRNVFKSDRDAMAAVDLNQLVADAIDNMRAELEAHVITVELSLGADLPQIKGHGDQLHRVLLNLLHNAVDALGDVASRKRVVRIETGRNGPSHVTIKVEDSGPGIDPKIAGEIFDLFKTTKDSGMGLGLTLCRIIVEQHGGEIVASSPDGAQFQIFLPAI